MPSTSASRLTGLRKGAWTEEEDALLRNAIAKYGEGKWHKVPARAGLNRCRKSCRLRWLNYLRPDIKRGDFGADEIDLIVRLHKLLGNRWSLIAGRLPGRTANDVKNYWNTHLFKKLVARRTPDSKQLRPAKNFITGNSKTTKQAPTNNINVLVKPKPLSFSNNVKWMNREEKESAGAGAPVEDVSLPARVQFEKESCSSASNSMQFWWDNLFADSDALATVADSDIIRLSPAAGGGVPELQDGGGATAPSSSFFPLESEFWDLLFSDD